MTKKGKARLIIGIFAASAAAWSAGTATVPVVGPVLADTPGLTFLSIGMAYALSALYDKSISTAGLMAFSTVVLGAILGNLGLKIAASLLSIFGSGVNATITAILHTAIGLVICEIYDEGKNLDDISISDFRERIKSKKREAEEEKKRYDEAFAALSPEKQERVKELQERLKELQKRSKKENISDSEFDEINNEISNIFGFDFHND